jgi:hypothetical protein
MACMSKRILKINLLPVAERSEVQYLIDTVLEDIGKAREIMDEYGAQYDHETPWRQAYVADAKFYLYRVRIGAIGRINTCRDAVTLGIAAKTRALSHHFTSSGLYWLFRFAREQQRKYFYRKKLQGWLSNMLKDQRGRNDNSRFINYNAIPSEVP